ncbi:MAG: hypothetical protein R3B72_26290 [Polyangiaceae bacterium]
MIVPPRFAALLAAALTLTAAPPLRADEAADREAALTQDYETAQEHYLAKRYTEALPLFRRVADGLDSPNAQLYVARCHRELGDLVTAYAAMSETIVMAERRAAEEPRFARTAEEARHEQEALAAKLGRLTVVVSDPPEGLVVEVAGRRVEPGREVMVDPGEVRVDAIAPGRTLQRETVRIQPGSSLTHRVAFPAEPPPPVPVPPPPVPEMPPASEPGWTEDGSIRIIGYATAGIGVAGFVTLAVAGSMANGLYSRLQEECGETGPCADDHSDDIARGETLDTLANVGLGVGIGGVVLGGLLIIFGGPSDAPAPASALSFAPLPGGGLLGYRARF